ncbi:MAG TPA: glycosyltransferase [Burkholderiaceae bacterium]|jgi:alpha-1,6-mannosyltransferase|nr:glycosyltransferase [Burkholderiaceae bacterium]
MSDVRGEAPLHLVDTTMFWSSHGGGVRRYLLAKRAQLVREGHWRHTLVAPGAQGDGMVDCGGVPLPFSGGYRVPWRRAAAARLIASQRPDVIEAGDPYRLAWAAIDAARWCGVPAVLFFHSDVATLAAHTIARRPLLGPRRSQDLAHRAEQRINRYLSRLCDRFDVVLAPSRTMQHRLQALGVTHVQMQPLGVDTRVFSPHARDERWRGSLGLPADARLLLYAGRFAPEKNLPQLVEAVQRLGPRYHLLALGAGPQPPSGEQVHVLDFEAAPAQVAKAMASVDAFVHAGDQETGGLAVLEAMACGTPVVVRDAGGLSETVADGCGLAVDSSRPHDWAEAIAEVFVSNRASVHAALARARSHDWTLVLAALQRRYARAIERRQQFRNAR